MRFGIKRWIRYFFGISRTEANGVIVLTCILLLASFLPLALKKFRPLKTADPSEQEHLDSLITMLDRNLVPFENEQKAEESDEHDSVSYFSFNPNTANLQDFLKLGLGSEISNRIIKYRQQGGRFYNKENLLKIYGLSEEKYLLLAPYIQIEEELVFEEPIDNNQRGDIVANPEPEMFSRFDINRVDSSGLIIVNGIGKVLSGRIIKFRESLGGFVKMEQLFEVYGIEEAAYGNLGDWSYIEEGYEPMKININDWPADSMARHPYIDKPSARVIVAYREQHGDFTKSEDLMEILVLSEDWVLRISPYLEF